MRPEPDSQARGFVTSHSLPVPEQLTGSARRRWIAEEIHREQQARGAPVWVGLFEDRSRLWLVMSALQGFALGPSVCMHYQEQTDFLWLEQMDENWVWCLVRMGVPIAEGIDTPGSQILEALSIQKGLLTVNSPQDAARSWLSEQVPEGLELRWLRLEIGSWNSLQPQLKMRPASALLRELRMRLRLRWSGAAALLVAAVSAGWVLLPFGGLADATGPIPVPIAPPKPQSFAPPADLAMELCYLWLIELWQQGAGDIELQLATGKKPLWKLQVRLLYPGARQSILSWAKARDMRAVGRDDSAEVLSLEASPLKMLRIEREKLRAGSKTTVAADNPAHLLHMASLQDDSLLLALKLKADSDWRLRTLSFETAGAH